LSQDLILIMPTSRCWGLFGLVPIFS